MNADEKIWRYLKSAGLNDFGVAGLMGNLFAESGLNPMATEFFWQRMQVQHALQ